MRRGRKRSGAEAAAAAEAVVMAAEEVTGAAGAGTAAEVVAGAAGIAEIAETAGNRPFESEAAFSFLRNAAGSSPEIFSEIAVRL